MKRNLAIRALEMAVALRRPPKNCIHHFDRGSQAPEHCLQDDHKQLRQHGLKVSMSGKGNCYGNATVEVFFKAIKAQLIWCQSWQTRRQVELAVFEYVNGFYKLRHKHSAFGVVSLGF